MTDRKDYREALVDWTTADHLVQPENIAKWHKGTQYHHLPTKQQLREQGPAAVAEGWLPDGPIISPDTRVLAVGSCFARYFTLWLAENGFNRAFRHSPYNAMLHFNSDFESAAVIAQQFRWAFDELDPAALLWIDKNRRLVAATDEGKQEVRATLEQTDVLILTLGLSEIWYDKVSGEPLWRALTEDKFDPDRHVFRVETVAQTIEWLEAIERIRAAHLPRLKIVFTVSPVPLKTTFRPVSAVTANTASKAILRAALDEFLRRHEAQLGETLFYFPSYELVTQYFVDPFREDNRHLTTAVPAVIIALFVEKYCRGVGTTPQATESLADFAAGRVLGRVMRHVAIAAEGESRELLVRIGDLEEDVGELQRICDERQVVIDELKHAADERLALLEQVHAAAAERLVLLEKADAAAAERQREVERLEALLRRKGKQGAAE